MEQLYNLQQSRHIQHVVVRYEPGRFFGWPANGGIWSWGNEILVQYKHGEFQDKPVGSHDINYNKPITIDQSRSLDGGLTWTHYSTPIYSTEDGVSPTNATALTTPIDFSDPDTILKFEWSGYLYYSTDRGVNWKGPYILPKFDMVSLQLRTDYIIEDRNTCLAFWSMSKENFKRAENGDMVYMVKTNDGGITWIKEAHISRQVNPSDNRHDVAIMPSTVRVSPTKLVTCIRNLTAYPKVGWIECRVSTDNGKNWILQSTPVGDEAGTTPPALSRLDNGRLVLTYGYRKPIAGPTSIRAKISDDEGKTWSREIILRTGGGDEDIGYTRNVVRPDGKIVTIYYWQEDEKSERYIAATIWSPDDNKSSLLQIPERRTWAREPVIPNKITNSCEPVAYSGQRLDPESYLGQRVDINYHTGLLKTFNVDDYLSSYSQNPKWPTGEYLGKFMQGLSRMYLYTGDSEALERLDRIVEVWLKIQKEDGWLGTTERFKSWDIWEHKYVLLGLLDYYALTGDRRALNAACKIGDLLCANIGPGLGDINQSGHWALGSASILEPMTYLYRYTGEPKYLRFCEYIVESFESPTGPKLISIMTTGSKRVCDVEDPWANRAAREIKFGTTIGQIRNRSKGYEMLSCIIGLARIYQLTGNPEYLSVAINAWQDISKNRLYIAGSSGADECFKDDHCLPAEPSDGPAEACVTAHWIYLSRILFQITGEVRYLDAVENALFNYMLASQRPQDCYQSYNTPLNGSKTFAHHDTSGKVRGAPCCISSTMREIAGTPESLWAKFADDGLAVLIYHQGTMEDSIITTNGDLVTVGMDMETNYPSTGQVMIRVHPGNSAKFRLALRVPGWAKSFTAEVAHEKYSGHPGSFLNLEREWHDGDTIRIAIDLNDRLISGGASYPGHFAFMRGPQVLTLIANTDSKDSLKSAVLDVNRDIKLSPVQGFLPNGWVGDQAYTTPALVGAKGCALVPFGDAGQPGKPGDFRTWIPAHRGTTTPVPTAPSDLKAVALSGNQIQLVWSDNSLSEDGFRLERKRSDIGIWFHVKTTPASVNHCIDDKVNVVLPGKTYTYRVAAYNAGGLSPYSHEVTVTTPITSTPTRPSNLKASVVSKSRINLVWTDEGDNEEGFQVQCRISPDDQWKQIAGRVPANLPVFTDYGLEPGRTYTYRVRSFNAAGESDWSNEVTATISALEDKNNSNIE